MGVSGQLHASTVLPPGKEPLVPVGEEAGWAPKPILKVPLSYGDEPSQPLGSAL